MTTKLSVNLNKIALLRNSRDGNTPNPVIFGALALKAGAARSIRGLMSGISGPTTSRPFPVYLRPGPAGNLISKATPS